MQEILKYLKTHGQRLDSEIAEATGIQLKQVQQHISALAALGEISKCTVTRFNGDVTTTGTLCRPAGYSPPGSPGRKPGIPAKEAA